MNTEKECFKCKETKPLSEYYKHAQMADGHVNKCKKCNKIDVSKNRAKNIEHYREYDRERGNRQDSEYLKSYRKEYPRKYKAHNSINNALRDGRMKKETNCSQCNSDFHVHAHHDDYKYPFTVRWLCAACHKAWHEKNGEGLNGK